MRIAVISDVHGNYPALVKVLEDAVLNNVDKFIFIGDYIFDLPFSNDVVRLLMKLDNSYIIKGNKETFLCKLANENPHNWTYNQMGAVYQTVREMPPDVYGFLHGLDEEGYIQLSHGVSVYAVHYLKIFKALPKTNCSSSNFHKKMLAEPFSHEQFLSEFSDLINSEECRAHINNIDANIILFGHNHLQSYAYCGDKLVLNPGSCGQPLDFDPSAAYSIIEVTDGGFNVLEKRVSYDIEATISRAKQSKLYEKGRIWVNLVFLALRTGRDYFGLFFEIAGQIALSKNENGLYFSNPTWEEANEIFVSRYKDMR